jgi:hypothetical protein
LRWVGRHFYVLPLIAAAVLGWMDLHDDMSNPQSLLGGTNRPPP